MPTDKEVKVKFNQIRFNLTLSDYCNRYTDDNWYETRLKPGSIMHKFPVTYTAGRRKKHKDGTHTAVKAEEILMVIGGK